MIEARPQPPWQSDATGCAAAAAAAARTAKERKSSTVAVGPSAITEIGEAAFMFRS